MSLACVCGAHECYGCGRCDAAPLCNSCQVAIGRGQEYYVGTFGIICNSCSESARCEDDTVCSLCEERILRGEEIIFLGDLAVCGECADRCIR